MNAVEQMCVVIAVLKSYERQSLERYLIVRWKVKVPAAEAGATDVIVSLYSWMSVGVTLVVTVMVPPASIAEPTPPVVANFESNVEVNQLFAPVVPFSVITKLLAGRVTLLVPPLVEMFL